MKNIVLTVGLNEESINRLKSLHDDLNLKHAKIHLVHFFEIQYYVSEFTPYVFPSEDQFSEMEKSAREILKKLGNDLGISDENLTIQVSFSKSREQSVLDYLKKNKADLVVSATRGKHGIDGLFSSSFTDYLIKYSPCDVLVLRPKK